MESVHFGDLAVVNGKGKLIYYAGNPSHTTYIRSAAKPFQLIPLMKHQIHQYFAFTEQELAVMTSSHSGEKGHVEQVLRILEKAGLSPDFLKCGTHAPTDGKSRQELYRQGLPPHVLHCNCSGKHSGMLALCKAMGWDYLDYLHVTHPLQQEILAEISHVTSFPQAKIGLGVDGCGAPVYALPLTSMAWGYARLAEGSGVLGTISAIMRKNPWYVGGTGRFETHLMKVQGDRLVAKTGAEGIFCLGILPEGLGVAVKISDGNSRALPPVLVQLLRDMGLLSSRDFEELQDFARALLYNHSRMVVGDIQACFQLKEA